MELLREMFDPEFLLRHALYASLAIGLVCPLVGVYLVLRRLVFLGIAIPQISAAGIAFAYLLHTLGVHFYPHEAEEQLMALTSINFRWRAVNSVIYFMGMAKSREELDRVITLARMSGVQRIVSHVFLTDAFVFDGAPSAPARETVEPARGKTVKTVASPESDAAKKKTIAEENADHEKTFPKRGPPGVPPEMPTYYERSIDKLY